MQKPTSPIERTPWPVLFNFADAPTPERTGHAVGIAVKTFLAAYRPR
ncbi:MAG TPA: TetR/AcrR family transcriptional regulator C-terminal domain-containing protein [Xanthobacteraceae bacterium]|nr:TetR/AcrR family transcriptional regulator C-terminal domain-containing protein [Xanthobacteraceae bacterium]